MVGQWQQPQAEHSGEPLGDPSARVFEVFLTVLDGVQGETLIISQSVSRRNDAVFGGMKSPGAVRRRIANFSTEARWSLAKNVPLF